MLAANDVLAQVLKFDVAGCGNVPVTVTVKSALAGPPGADQAPNAQLMVGVVALVHAYTENAAGEADAVSVGAATPDQSTEVLLPVTDGVVGTPGMLAPTVHAAVSTVVLVEPTRNRMSLGTVTLRFTLAVAVTVPVPAEL